MNKTERAMHEIRSIDELASKDSFIHRMSPLSKLFITVFFIVVTASFDRYNLTGIFAMILYPILLYQLSGIPITTCFSKLKIVMPLVCAVGILNPFLETETVMFGTVSLRIGIISMLTLMLKGVYCLLQSFIFVATTSVDEICRSLRKIHVPRIITSLVLLTVRYVSVMLEEVTVMSEAYHLRAPKHKGIHIRAWGSFLGQLLLRSMDRAEVIYESMLLRGFDGDMHHAEGAKENLTSWIFFLLSAMLLIVFRMFDITEIIGRLFV